MSLYVAAVTALGVTQPRLWLLILALVTAPAVVVFGNLSLKPEEREDRLVTRAALALVATAIWTLAVPGSGWQAIDSVRENPGAVAVIAAFAGLIFGLVAEGLLRSDKQPRQPN